MTYCSACGENRKLIKAHIIPKSFYMDLREAADRLNIVHNLRNVSRISRIGDYDTNILCAVCDGFIGQFDQYGKEILLDRKKDLIQVNDFATMQILGWYLENVDIQRLKIFFYSILWRASITERPFFRRIVLTDEEKNRLRSFVFDNKNDDDFGVVISKFQASSITNLEKTILDPDIIEIEKVRHARFYLGGYNICIRIDLNGPAESFKNVELESGKLLRIAPRDFDTSKELEVLLKTLNSTK